MSVARLVYSLFQNKYVEEIKLPRECKCPWDNEKKAKYSRHRSYS